jgi:hypothetical protein
VTFQVDAALIGTIIGSDLVPFEGCSFPDSMVSPTMEELLMFLDPHHQAQDRVSHSIKIGIFSSPHCLAKIVQHNLWPTAWRSELVYKRAISICFDSTDFLLSLQAHCAHYAGDA